MAFARQSFFRYYFVNINIANRKGYLQYTKKLASIPKDEKTGFVEEKNWSVMGSNTMNSGAIDSLSWHILLVFIAAGLGYLSTFIVNKLVSFYKALLLTLFCAVLGMSRFFEGVDHSAFLGLLIALASSLTWTFYLVFADKSGLSDEDPLTLAFWLCVLNAVVGGGMGAVSGYSFGEANALYFLAIAAAFALVYLTMVLAIRVCGAALMSVLSVFEPISAILLGLVFLHDSISPKHSQGVCIVLASITFFLVSNYLKSNKANRT